MGWGARGVAPVAGRGQLLLIGAPGQPRGRQLVEDVFQVDLPGHDGVRARLPIGASRGHGQIVRERRVGDRVVVREERPLAHQGVDVRTARVPDDRVVLMILHHDDGDMRGSARGQRPARRRVPGPRDPRRGTALGLWAHGCRWRGTGRARSATRR